MLTYSVRFSFRLLRTPDLQGDLRALLSEPRATSHHTHAALADLAQAKATSHVRVSVARSPSAHFTASSTDDPTSSGTSALPPPPPAHLQRTFASEPELLRIWASLDLLQVTH